MQEKARSSDAILVSLKFVQGRMLNLKGHNTQDSGHIGQTFSK